MSYGAANRIFHGNGSYSPFGTTVPSGSHLGNKSLYLDSSYGRADSLFVNIENSSSCHSYSHSYYPYSYGCDDLGLYNASYGFGGGCCHGSGISDKTAAWTFGISTCVGFLASPLGATIFKGIGKGCSWLWNKAITPAAKWTWNSVLKPIGKGIGQAASWTWNKAIKPAATWTYDNILKPVGQGIGNFFKGCWNLITGKGWDGTK